MRSQKIRSFQKTIYAYYKTHGRKLPWRKTRDPYKILVSEIMLQQTQVYRVLPKYAEFIKRFLTFRALAKAPLPAVLKAWQGLGYNRRALALKRIAEIVEKEYKGKLPKLPALLEKLPCIGPATAASISAFAWNTPSVFIETNIRTVFIHFFFKNKKVVRDEEILKLVRETLGRKNPREWYWALMDYGAMLKSNGAKYNSRSAHYTKQSKFKGSDRQVRGAILRALLKQKEASSANIRKEMAIPNERLSPILNALIREGFIKKQKGSYYLQTTYIQ